MTKAEIVSAVADATGISKAEADKALVSVLSAIADSLEKGDSVSLVGFGAFNVKHRDARAGKNPQTGETIQIAARKVVSFKPSAALKQKINS